MGVLVDDLLVADRLFVFLLDGVHMVTFLVATADAFLVGTSRSHFHFARRQWHTGVMADASGCFITAQYCFLIMVGDAVQVVTGLLLGILQHTVDLQAVEPIVVLAMLSSLLFLNRFEIGTVRACLVELANFCDLLRNVLLIVKLHNKGFFAFTVLQ